MSAPKSEQPKKTQTERLKDLVEWFGGLEQFIDACERNINRMN